MSGDLQQDPLTRAAPAGHGAAPAGHGAAPAGHGAAPSGHGAGARPLAEVVGAGLTVPLVQGGEARYVNLDLAASAPPLRRVVDRLTTVLPWYASVHRGAGFPSVVCTALLERAREDVGRLIGA